MEMGDFTVADGQHTATRNVAMPLDIFIRESQKFDISTMSFSKELETRVTPRTIALESKAQVDSTGTGWCAPSS
jgi:hypothetical protein